MLIVWIVLLLVILGLLVYLDWYAKDKFLEVSAATRSDWCGPKEPYAWKQQRRVRILMLVLFGAGFLLVFLFLLWIKWPLGKSILISFLLSAVLVATKGSFMDFMLLRLINQGKKMETAGRKSPDPENAGELWESDDHRE